MTKTFILKTLKIQNTLSKSRHCLLIPGTSLKCLNEFHLNSLLQRDRWWGEDAQTRDLISYLKISARLLNPRRRFENQFLEWLTLLLFQTEEYCYCSYYLCNHSLISSSSPSSEMSQLMTMAVIVNILINIWPRTHWWIFYNLKCPPPQGFLSKIFLWFLY